MLPPGFLPFSGVGGLLPELFSWFCLHLMGCCGNRGAGGQSEPCREVSRHPMHRPGVRSILKCQSPAGGSCFQRGFCGSSTDPNDPPLYPEAAVAQINIPPSRPSSSSYRRPAANSISYISKTPLPVAFCEKGDSCSTGSVFISLRSSLGRAQPSIDPPSAEPRAKGFHVTAQHAALYQRCSIPIIHT